MPGATATKTILIAGCGDLGTQTGILLRDAGHRVIGVRRRAEVLPEGFERESVDLTTERPAVPPETDVVVVALASGERSAEAYRSVYVDGLRHVLEAIVQAEATPRIVLVSSTAVYGVDDGSWVDEGTRVVPPTPTAEVLREAESVLESANGESVIVRLGGVYGPGRERLIDQVRSGEGHVPKGSLFTNRIHRDDAARALVHLALLADAPPPVVIAVDDEPAQLTDVLEFIAGSVGVEAPRPPLLSITGTPRPQGGDRRLSNALLRATGFRFRYPSYREGYSAVLRGDGVRHP